MQETDYLPFMTQNSNCRSLGQSDVHVFALGLGCMGMSFAYGPTDDTESLSVLRRYFDLGGNFLDTAEIYGPYTNEELLGKFLREIPRERVVIATKFGFKFENGRRETDSSPANVRRACDASLRRLGIEVIDLFLPTPGRSSRANRGDRRCDGRTCEGG
jgi:aryl-alcohol dehydrogenase-like predicted oxidoreductase